MRAFKQTKDKNEVSKFYQIIKKIAKGKKGGFEEFYELYGKFIFSAAYSICRASDKAEEVVDKVLVKIWKLSESLEGIKNPEGWLYVLSVNCAKDLLRETAWIPLREEFPDRRDRIQELIEEDAFYTLIEFLSEEEQEIIIEKIMQRLTFEEIAQETKKPLGTVTVTYYRALKKIKEKIEKVQNNV